MLIGLQTEYSFRNCYGKVEDTISKVVELGYKSAGIADFGNTFGHRHWEKVCIDNGIKPIFGVRLNVVESGSKQRSCHTPYTIIALNTEGLVEIHRLVQLSYERFYYIPRIFIDDLASAKNCEYFTYWEMPLNRYVNPQDDVLYQVLAGSQKRGDDYVYSFQSSTLPRHILSKAELSKYYGDFTDRYTDTANRADVKLNISDMAKYKGENNIEDLCIKGAIAKGIDLDDPVYKKRYEREMELIIEKDYVDYFLITQDMVEYAKKHMLVGPSRGSSAGSLVCYLLSITEIDPIKWDLIFERFIDINRFDLPDIDIDFADDKRYLVEDYLKSKYGEDKVKTLANISRYKPRSSIDTVAKSINISKYELEDVKNSIIKRSGADARASMCVGDTFDTTTHGKEIVIKYPQIRLSEEIEGHASHSGKHASGILVANLPLYNYGSVDTREDTIQLDKYSAMDLNLLKIDCLGLRTLSILQQTAELVGMDYHDYYKLPLDDKKTFDMFNSHRFSGIFQFEGYSLQALVKEMDIAHINDIISITALCRPGPLNSGGAILFAKIHSGKEQVKYLAEHPEVVEATRETFGIIIYQEQLMSIARGYGSLSWADVCSLRAAVSKSLGEEFFNKFKDKFIKGAVDKGRDLAEAESVWLNMMTFGSWGFNKSHAVSYGIISYWTAYMKSHHPLEFYNSCLNNTKDEISAVRILRDAVANEGIEYTPVDADLSTTNWSIQDGKLLGGLVNINGIAEKKAMQIIRSRKSGKLTPSMFKLLSNPITPYDDIFQTKSKFGHIIKDYKKYGFNKEPITIDSIRTNMKGDLVFIGRLERVNLRDMNEYELVLRRDGKRMDENSKFLNMVFGDDTGSIICSISRFLFDKLNADDIVENGVVNESWYLIGGLIGKDWRMVNVKEIYNIDNWSK